MSKLSDFISTGGEFPVGTVANWKLDPNAPGWLDCDGSLYPEAEYPELAAMLKAIVANGPEGFFYVPDKPKVIHGNVAAQPKIKAE